MTKEIEELLRRIEKSWEGGMETVLKELRRSNSPWSARTPEQLVINTAHNHINILLDTIRKLIKEGDWRSMNSVPIDGNDVLFYIPKADKLVCMGFMDWCPSTQTYYPSDQNFAVLEPTHWMPLPQPPKGDG